jgi:hypothetical protein
MASVIPRESAAAECDGLSSRLVSHGAKAYTWRPWSAPDHTRSHPEFQISPACQTHKCSEVIPMPHDSLYRDGIAFYSR